MRKVNAVFMDFELEIILKFSNGFYGEEFFFF